MCAAAKKMPRGKFIAWNAYIREEKTSFYLMKLEKEEKAKLEVNRKKNKIKIKLIKWKIGSFKGLIT